MSQENVEVIRAGYEAWAEGGVEAILRLVDEAIELRLPPGWPGVGPFRGHEGLRAAFRESRDVFADVRMRPERFIDLDGQILVLGKVLVRSKGAEVEMEGTLSHLWTMRQGKAIMLQIYGDPQRALEAAGLREWAMSQENVEVVRSAHVAFARGDLEQFLSLIHPDVEFTSLIVEAETGGAFRGHQGVMRWFQAVSGAFGDFHAEVESVQPLGPHHVIARLRMSGVTEGVEVTQTMWQAAIVRSGKLAWWGIFRTEQEAINAVGLRE